MEVTEISLGLSLLSCQVRQAFYQMIDQNNSPVIINGGLSSVLGTSQNDGPLVCCRVI